MARIDPVQERQRLMAFYSGQLDGELEKVAGQAAELTEIAREVLRDELSRRGLNTEPLERALVPLPVPLAPPIPPPRIKTPSAELPAWLDADLALRELVTLRKFRDIPEALLAKGCLESAGADPCFVGGNNGRLGWVLGQMFWGVTKQ